MVDWRGMDALRATRRRGLTAGAAGEVLATSKPWLMGLPLAALILTGTLLCLQPARYSAQAQILTGPRAMGLIGLRASLANSEAGGGLGPAAQVQLIASRDIARRAIKDLGLEDNVELDPAAQGLGPVSRALIFLGMIHDPARKSQEDRILDAFLDRLQVSGPGRHGLVTIAFQSENRDLAASAANRVADLYLDMRAAAKNAAPHSAEPRFFSRASPPARPLSPVSSRNTVLLLSGTVMAFVAFAVTALRPFSLLVSGAGRAEQSPGLGPQRVIARFKPSGTLGPRAAELASGPILEEHVCGASAEARGAADAMTRILSAAPRESQALRIVAAPTEASRAAYGMMLDLARGLARQRRSIAINLDPFSAPQASPALGELLAGTASFAEVIRRDPASRLHILPLGQSGDVELQEFESVLETLAGTYDVIVIIVPPFDRNESGKILAAKADFAVLGVPALPAGGAFEAERQLVESGAGEVLLVAGPSGAQRAPGRDAA